MTPNAQMEGGLGRQALYIVTSTSAFPANLLSREGWKVASGRGNLCNPPCICLPNFLAGHLPVCVCKARQIILSTVCSPGFEIVLLLNFCEFYLQG